MTRIVCFCLGWLMVALGCIGMIVPLMPTTIFLILAAWFFARSSPRFEAWLLAHPRFGPALRVWRKSGAVSRQGKIAACLGIAAGFGLFWVGTRPGAWLGLAVAVVLLASALYVISRPAPPTTSASLNTELRGYR